ncbi:hypothetical protein B0H17DRAFT_930914 [Mycena rosella]|uniref:Uncharacterized protein n=1 Tax=Mycena rosella TaxID=1033263 RepID=A0AAD7DN41_MYCRO|nr:hypothetical protein B0H17DRAFT_930914 [Mycena rosella]
MPSRPFPHTRAQLSAIARQYKPLPGDGYDGEPEDDTRVSTEFVEQIVALLVDEREDELKALLKAAYGMDEEMVEQSVLDLMHKHHDDEAGVPFLFLTPTRRPISRPSSRASARLRPDTPNSAPSSPLGLVFRRPHTPLTSPLAPNLNSSASSYMTAKNDYSPQSSPVLSHAPQFTASLPSSPLSSPRLLNAKANEFKPIPRPLSAASSNPGALLRAETPSPDMWSHSPLRSSLAIAAPLIPERSVTPSSSLRSSMLLRDEQDDEEEEDPFDPFAARSLPRSFHSLSVSDYDTQWSNSSNSNSSRSPESLNHLPSHFSSYPDSSEGGFSPPEDTAEMEAAAAAMLTEGMTPFDVLSSVFGSTLAPSELEDALAANGYDFERAMAWLVDRAVPVPPQPSPQLRIQQMGGRVTVVARDPARGRGGPDARSPPRYVNGRPTQGGNRVCRYFVAGECLRADCRFSHDLERALCRFWLRGTCAKQDNCEFLHHLPKDVDMSSLSAAMSRANVPPGTGPLAMHTALPSDDFPALGIDGGKGRRGGYSGYNDPGRTRFATAVKKSVPPLSAAQLADPTLIARREAMGHSADNLYHRSAIVAPRPSPRLKLRPPALLPTLPTGEAINSMYMSYRSRALQLGAARNACLSRAADAWRRGDGAAAKRFSREGHELNDKMSKEMAGAAAKLVRERAKLAEQAVRTRDAGWSDDPGDRAARGRSCGGGLGVCLGIAGRDVGDGKLSGEERTECMLDLHGLHSNEATEVLEGFLLALEQEHFYGLAYVVVGEEKHTGTQDPARGASRARLATGVREWVHRWGYPWSERDGIICVDALTHASE